MSTTPHNTTASAHHSWTRSAAVPFAAAGVTLSTATGLLAGAGLEREVPPGEASTLFNNLLCLGKLRQAYGLCQAEFLRLLGVLWPRHIQALEVWRQAHELYWNIPASSAARRYACSAPQFPSLHVDANPYASLDRCRQDVERYLAHVCTLVPAIALAHGLRHVLEMAYEGVEAADDPASVTGRIHALVQAQQEVERAAGYADSEEAMACTALQFESLRQKRAHTANHLSFVETAFCDAILVPVTAAVRVLADCPLRMEVKGLTHAHVQRVLQVAPSASVTPAAATCVIPAHLWRGKPPQAVRDAMRGEYDDCCIAHVLVHWCAISRTQAGRLLYPDKYQDDKSYRNAVAKLL